MGSCTNTSYDLVSTVTCEMKVASTLHTIKLGTAGQRGSQANALRVSRRCRSPELSHSPDAKAHRVYGHTRREQQRRQTLRAVFTVYPRWHVPDGSTFATGGAGAGVAGTNLALQSGLVQTLSLGLFAWDRPTRAGPGSGRSKRKIAPPR